MDHVGVTLVRLQAATPDEVDLLETVLSGRRLDGLALVLSQVLRVFVHQTAEQTTLLAVELVRRQAMGQRCIVAR